MANELHTMPLKIEALLSSQRVRLLELDEFGAYMKLLCDAWLNGGYLPKQCLSNAKAIEKLCGCNAEAAERIIENVVKVFFDDGEDGKLRNNRQTELYSQTVQHVQMKTIRALKGAEARWGSSSNAKAKPEQCQPKPKPKPKPKEKESKPKNGFTPPTIEDVQEYCSDWGQTIDCAAFVDHFTASGWKLSNGNTMKDWHAAVRNWKRNETRWSKPRQQPLGVVMQQDNGQLQKAIDAGWVEA